MDYFLYYQYTVTGLLLIILVNFVVNNFFYKSPSNYSLSEELLNEPPLVSILVPARNEEENIGRCLRSLVRQDYSNIEILVLNDNSTDATGIIVSDWSKKDSRIRLLNGKPLKTGWKGKSYACHQLSTKAKGRYLIFTDADTLHFPDSVSSSLAALSANSLDAMSVFPRQIMVTIHEKMVIIFINIAILALMPIWLIRRIKSSKLSIANGQFFLFKRETYDGVGGHKNIRKEIVEDVALSKQVKKCGFNFMVFDGRNNIHCRMYNGFNEVSRGFSKFIFAAMNYRITNLVSTIIMIMVLFLFPLMFLPMGLYVFDWPMMININLLTQVSVVLLIRIVMTFRFKTRLIDILLHPFSMFYITILAINSVYQAKYGRGIYWKDRYYSIDESEEIEAQELDI